ncbi:hypothetical protein CL657_00565 [bacterium]|nr:hypothetical protein [bacterium]
MSLATKTYVKNHLDSTKKESIFSTLFNGTNGYEIALKDKKMLNVESNRSFTYGEIAYDGFKAVLELLDRSDEVEFMDFGSGIGKALVCASMTLTCKRLIGIEKLPTLASVSKELLNQYNDDLKESYPDIEIPSILISEESFDSISLNNVDVLFVSGTCFSDDVIDSIAARTHELKVGANIISFTRQLSSNHLECIYKGSHKMEWGLPTVFIYKRK